MTQRSKNSIALASLAISGLCLLPAWDAILGLPELAKGWEPITWLFSGTLIACLLAAVGLGRWPRIGWFWRALAGFVLAICLFETTIFFYNITKIALKMSLGADYPVIQQWFFKVFFFIGLCSLAISIWRLGLQRTFSILESSIRVLAPLPLVLLATYFLNANSVSHRPISVEPAKRVVVVLVYDELDDAAISADLNSLPHFAAIKKHGLSTSSMYPPANYTSESLPSMLTGEIFKEVVISHTDVHVLHTGESAWRKLSNRGNLFEDAIARKQRTAVVGWYLPYCGFVNRAVSCWDDASYRAPGNEVSLLEWMLGNSFLYNFYESRRLASLAGNIQEYSRELLSSARMYRLKRIGSIYSTQSRELIGALESRRFELVFAHMSCPHAPSLVSSEINKLDMFQAYEKNLRECDKLLGSVKQLLKDGDYSDGYALIVTSDHWFRGRDWQDAGKPLESPRVRRTVPFHLLLSGDPPSERVTDAVTNSRVLRKFIDAASSPTFTYEEADYILMNQGDSQTFLRPF